MTDRSRRILLPAVLTLAALVFVLPFYVMAIGAFQESPTNTPAALLPIGDWTLQNFVLLDERVNLTRGLLNSFIVTAGVVVGTLVFGMPAGYALAKLRWRGRGALFVTMLIVQVIPFQLLMIPLYIQVAGMYGLGDTYLGMMLPFLVNTTAVFIFRQYFLSIPDSLFEAARIDGAGELRIMMLIAAPLMRPAIVTVVLVTFIGPWNEFLWPFLITKDTALQPLAVGMANFITNVATFLPNPNGAILAGSLALALPVLVVFALVQRHIRADDLGTGIRG
jgi:multiple sugar transport system permease protein